jgi:hypothetical protein
MYPKKRLGRHGSKNSARKGFVKQDSVEMMNMETCEIEIPGGCIQPHGRSISKRISKVFGGG